MTANEEMVEWPAWDCCESVMAVCRGRGGRTMVQSKVLFGGLHGTVGGPGGKVLPGRGAAGLPYQFVTIKT